jgi:hypothetical protein
MFGLIIIVAFITGVGTGMITSGLAKIWINESFAEEIGMGVGFLSGISIFIFLLLVVPFIIA